MTGDGTDPDNPTDPEEPTAPTPSKHVVPTGSGYLGTYSVDATRKVTISTAALGDRDWIIGSRVHALEHESGVALVRDHAEDTFADYGVTESHTGSRIAAGQDATEKLECEPGDEIRVYDLEVVDGRDGLLLVDADDDPRTATDGGFTFDGTDVASSSDHHPSRTH